MKLRYRLQYTEGTHKHENMDDLTHTGEKKLERKRKSETKRDTHREKECERETDKHRNREIDSIMRC